MEGGLICAIRYRMNYPRLVWQCRRGNRRAQKELYELFKGQVMGICRRYARESAEADDIFHESMVKVFQKIDSLKDPQTLPAWVRQVVINTATNQYRANLKLKYHDDYTTLEESSEADVNVLDKLSNDELLAQIARLPEGYRVVFNLYVIDGYTHPQIAQMLNISVGTSKSQLHAAKKMLRSYLQTLGIVSYEK